MAAGNTVAVTEGSRWEQLKDKVEVFAGGPGVTAKQALIGVPFIITEVAFRSGSFGPYVSVMALDQQDREFVFNDGSTGVYAQIVAWLHEKQLLDEKITKPDVQEFTGLAIGVKRGLRVSHYETPDGKPGSTYYLS